MDTFADETPRMCYVHPDSNIRNYGPRGKASTNSWNYNNKNRHHHNYHNRGYRNEYSTFDNYGRSKGQPQKKIEYK